MKTKLFRVKKALPPGRASKLIMLSALTDSESDVLVSSMRDIEAFAQHFLVYECVMINYDAFIKSNDALIQTSGTY